tara:strand:+ start:501 stop:737 length:237 start_codon:yes stop_codon:yes gene_type:complete
MTTSSFADICEVKNTNNGTTITAEIMDFKPTQRLTVSVNRSVKVTMIYNSHTNVYVGNMAGLEFTSAGPKETQSYKGR